jgi:hypothetical protein
MTVQTLQTHQHLDCLYNKQQPQKITEPKTREPTNRYIYNQSGVNQLTCNECQKRYIGQIDRPFRTRFKEHQQDYKHNGGKSLYAKHPIENSMHTLHTAGKERLLNTIENFYIHRETIANNQLNEKTTTKSNIIFDIIL